MTEERDNPQTSTDTLVSETYRAIAAERAPEHLNRAILRDAGKAARPRYLRSISWTRPLAWAATITLCVALVLEVSNLPAPAPESFNSDSFKPELQQSRRDIGDIAADDAPNSILEETMPARTFIAAPQSPESKTATKQVAAESELGKSLRDEARNEPVRARESTAGALDFAEFEVKDTDLLRRADEMARMQDGENKEEAPAEAAAYAASSPAALRSAVDSNAAESACDETARAAPESWYACIQELTDAGRADAAERQSRALAQAFPDFTPR